MRENLDRKPGHDRRPIRRSDVTLRALDDEYVGYDPRFGAVLRFNEATRFIWNQCDGSRTSDDIATRLTARYTVEPKLAKRHVDVTLDTFQTLGLLETEDAAEIVQPDTGPSRRELLRCGGTRLVFVAPLVSVFFTTGAFASGPSASAAIGAGGCKNVGYSCAANNDCCGNQPSETAICWQPTNTCCIKKEKSGCTSDADCCPDAFSGCVAGTCEE